MVSEHFIPQVGKGIPERTACAMTGQGAEKEVARHSADFLAFPLLICLTLGPQNQAIQFRMGLWPQLILSQKINPDEAKGAQSSG